MKDRSFTDGFGELLEGEKKGSIRFKKNFGYSIKW